MAVQTVQNLPAQFVQDLGVDLAKQVTAQSGVPVVSTGIAGISQQAGESAADFAARQQSCSRLYNKTTKFIRNCTTGSGPRCITTTSTKIADTRCRIISTIFKSSNITSTSCCWIRNHGPWTIRNCCINFWWSRNRSTIFSTRCTRFYVTISITSN